MKYESIREKIFNARALNQESFQVEIEQLLEKISIYQTELLMQNEELTRQQYELKQMKEEYQMLFNFAPVAYFIVEKDFRIYEVNKMGARMLGERKSVIQNQKFTNFIAENYQDDFYLFMRRLVKSNKEEQCEIILKGAYKAIHANVHALSIGVHKNKNHFLVAVTDIGGRLENESKLKQQNIELRKLNHELDRFTYSASHDLRAPLASIKGLTYLYFRSQDKTEKDTFIENIDRSANRLDEFLQEILHYSRNQNLDLDPQLLDFEEVINETLDSLSYLDRNGVVEKSVIVDIKGKFYTDINRLKIVLSNLISNAIKYSKPVNDSDNQSIIQIKATGNQQKVTISVKDNGMGIEEKHIYNIFDMFYRATDLNNGSGLGLYIVHETVQKMGGRITVESQPRHGSEFKVIIPNLLLDKNKVIQTADKG